MVKTLRQTKDERRENVLVAAIQEFAKSGFHGASTDAIARAAGISQPYLFRLFGSKKELYIAGVQRCLRTTLETMQRAAEGLRGEEALQAMGNAYGELIRTDPSMLQAQLQTYAAALDDDDIKRAVRDGYGDLYTYVERVSDASPARVSRFFAFGMLWNVIAAMGLHEEAEPDPWVARLIAGCKDPEQ